MQYPGNLPRPTNLANVGAVLSPYTQFASYPRLPIILSKPSYRPPNTVQSRHFEPITQPPNVMRPVYPRLPIISNVFRYIQPMMQQPPSVVWSRNIQLTSQPPNVMRALMYPRLPITSTISSYRPPNTVWGRYLQPVTQPPNVMKQMNPRLLITSTLPSYRPLTAIWSRNLQPIAQPPNVMRQINPRLPITANMPSYRPSNTVWSRNFQPITQPPNVMKPLMYPRLPISSTTTSHRNPTAVWSRNLQPSLQTPNVMIPVSYFNPANTWLGKTRTVPTSSMGTRIYFLSNSFSNLSRHPQLSTGNRQFPMGILSPGARYQLPALAQNQIPYNQLFSVPLRDQWQYLREYNRRPSELSAPLSYYFNMR